MKNRYEPDQSPHEGDLNAPIGIPVVLAVNLRDAFALCCHAAEVLETHLHPFFGASPGLFAKPLDETSVSDKLKAARDILLLLDTLAEGE